MCINFNAWFVSQDYRKNLSKSLGLKFNDKGLNIVPETGEGSSFDHRKFDGKAQKMKILDRWKVLKDKSGFRSLFRDPEIWKLSEKIFGKI